MFKATEEQGAILDVIAAGERSAVVQALAGTGKTTTLTQAVKGAPELGRAKVYALAFNKSAAEDLGRKMPRGVDSLTLHSLGYRMLRGYGIRARPDSRLNRDEAHRAVMTIGVGRNRKVAREVAGIVADMMSAAKNRLKRGDSVLPMLRGLDSYPSEDARADGWTLDRIAEAVNIGLDVAERRLSSSRCHAITFDDMVWGPLVLGCANPVAELVMVDEAQDLNASRFALANAVCGGRMVVVGDANQRIYGWNGALPDALGDAARKWDAVTLPLTITWRCDGHIVDVARAIVPEYRARPNAPDGQVTDGEVMDAQPGDMVLARSNAAVMGAALSLIRNGRPACILGNDVRARLTNMLDGAQRIAGGSRSASYVVKEARRQADREIRSAREDGLHRYADTIDDFATTLAVVAEGVADVADVRARIVSLIRDTGDKDGVTCMTVHKSKGAESDGVTVICDSLKGDEQGTEEGCVSYVAMSRAKRRMNLVRVEDGPDGIATAFEQLTPVAPTA